MNINKNEPYTIGITSKENQIDQKRNIIKTKPGYFISIKVTPKVLESSKDFESLNLQDRKCKNANETEGLFFTKHYSKVGCETNCALKFAMKKCNCLPWYIPNDFENVPVCDIFGGTCVEMLMSTEGHIIIEIISQELNIES